MKKNINFSPKRKLFNLKSISVFAIIGILIILVIINYKSNFIQNIGQGFLKLSGNNTTVIYDVTGVGDNNLYKVLIIFNNEDGFKKISYKPENGNTININGNSKTKIALDTTIYLDKNYQFETVTNNNTETITVNIPTSYVDNLISISVNETSQIASVNINNNIPEIEGKIYHKIGSNNNNWGSYQNQIDLNNYNLNLLGIQDLRNEDYDIYAKYVFNDGSSLIKRKNSNYIAGSFDVFKSCQSNGNSLANYGFSVISSNGETNNFATYNMGIGHGNYHGWYKAVFKLDMNTLLNGLKLNNMNGLNIRYQSSSGSSSYIKGTTTVYYTDGTSSVISTGNINSNNNQITSFNINYKQIDYILMQIDRMGCRFYLFLW